MAIYKFNTIYISYIMTFERGWHRRALIGGLPCGQHCATGSIAVAASSSVFLFAFTLHPCWV